MTKISRKSRVCMLGLGMIFACAGARAQDVVIVANKGVLISQISQTQLIHEVFFRNHVGERPNEFRTR